MKKAITFLFAVVCSIAATLAAPASPSAQEQESRAAAIGSLMQTWQSRILAFNLPVDDAKNWARRNMAKFSRLSADRLSLAQRAGTLGELELVLLDAPVPEGTHLDVLMATHPSDITMMSSRNVAKSSPATSPSSYAGLVFTALMPCRILDSRPSQGGSGSWMAGSSNLIKIGPYSTAGGGYATGPGAQGGSATSCGLDALAGPGQVAVIMAAVSTVSQVGAGYLTFYPQGAPNPGATSVSQWYQPGYVQTSFVLIPTDLVATVAASAFTSATTDVIIDVVGYFTSPGAASGALIQFSTGTIIIGATVVSASPILMGFGNHTSEGIDGSGESIMPPEAAGFAFPIPFAGTLQNLQISADLLVASVVSINTLGLEYDFTVFRAPSVPNNGIDHVSSSFVTTPLTSSIRFGFPNTVITAGTFRAATNINLGSLSVSAGDRIGIRIRTNASTDASAADIGQLSFSATLTYVRSP